MKRSKKLSKDQKIGIGLGLLGAGVVAYLFLSSSNASAATNSSVATGGGSTGGGGSSGGGSSSGGSISSGDQSSILGSGGSTTPLGPISGTGVMGF